MAPVQRKAQHRHAFGLACQHLLREGLELFVLESHVLVEAPHQFLQQR
jgi:hypothetical protein